MTHRTLRAWSAWLALVAFVGCVAEAQSPRSDRSIAIHKTHVTPKPAPPIAPVPPIVALPPATPPLQVTPPSVAVLPPSAVTPPDSDRRCLVCAAGLLTPFVAAIAESHGHDSHEGPLTPPNIPGYPQIPTLPLDSLPLVPIGSGGGSPPVVPDSLPVTATPDAPTTLLLVTGLLFVGLVGYSRSHRALRANSLGF